MNIYIYTTINQPLNDYRPVALTSHLESLERMDQIIRSSLDPLQFAYQPRLGVEDTIIFLLYHACAHLDRLEAL